MTNLDLKNLVNGYQKQYKGISQKELMEIAIDARNYSENLNENKLDILADVISSLDSYCYTYLNYLSL